MGFVANRAYNDPNIGAAFSNLAQLFAPPSAQDTAAYASANAARARARSESEEAARKQAQFAWLTDPANQSDPNFQRRADGYFLGNGGQPNQSFAMTTRGQDLESSDRRYGADRASLASMYGADRTYAASTENNVRDNERALTANRLDNQRSAITSLYGSLAPGETRPALPSNVTDLLGLPAIGAAAGAPKPLTESEVKGAERQRLLSSGSLTDQMLLDVIVGDKSPVEAIDPATGRPTFMSPGAAVRESAQPAPRQPLVNVNTGPNGDGKLREKLDESEGKRLSAIQEAGTTSAGLQQDLQALSELIKIAPQGPIEGRIASLVPGASNAGTAFQSIISRAAPGLRVEGSGATSDIEYQGMLNSLPALRNNPEANRLIVEMMRAKAAINVQRAQIITDYQTNRIDANAMRDQLAQLNNQSIMSPGLQSMIQTVGTGQSMDAGALPPGTEVDGYRYRGGDPGDPASWELVR